MSLTNDELLGEITRRVAAGEIEAAEIFTAVNRSGAGGAAVAARARGETTASRLSRILYYIGGGIVFFGLAFLIAQEWDRLGALVRILVTLGTGIAAFMSGVLLSQQKQLGSMGPSFFLISALMLPTGMFVSYDELGSTTQDLAVGIQIAAMLTVIYGTGWFLFRRRLLLFFTIVFGTWLLFWASDYLANLTVQFDRYEFSAYRVFVVGLAYVLIGHGFSGDQRSILTPWLYGFGILGVLGAGLALGGWKPDQNVFWEIFYPGLVFGVIVLSTYLKARSLLVLGSLFLGAYLVKITAEYFSDSLGWPFALVLVGFMLMGVAYFTVHINRRYL